ncbi:cohesin domain-containing protein [candidate division KSB1 bacterium]|nr:cohesin domain-containing protein [candidate division KSB1 bacterium]
MNKHMTTSAAFFLVLIFLPGLSRGSAPTVRINSSQLSFNSMGEQATVEIWADNVVNFGAFQFDIVYNPAVVHAQSVTLGGFLSSTGRTPIPVGPEIDNGLGQLRFAAATIGTNAGPDGLGIIATVTFQAQARGTTSLALQNVQLSDVSGNIIVTVRINPSQISLSSAGEESTVEIWADNVANLGAFQFDIIYNPAVVHAQSAILGGFLSSTDRTAIPAGPAIDNGQGRITYGAATFGTNAGPDGSGILATVTFQAQAQGTVPLQLQKVQLTDIDGNIIVGVEERKISTSELPTEFRLLPNYPNPFNPATRLVYQLPKSDKVSLRIINILGQEIRTLVDGERPAGSYEIIWDGRDNQGKRVAAGIYLAQFRAGSFVQTRKMLYLP